MSVRPTIQLTDPILKSANAEITDFGDPKIKQIITDLRDTMYDVGLIGISGPQIGENWKIFVTEPRETDVRPAGEADEFRVYINPKIISASQEKIIIWEGCGSVENANLFGPVERPQVVTVEAWDENGQKFRFTANGILGRVIQHEQDHLNQMEFTDLILDKSILINTERYLREVKNLPDQIQAQKTTLKKFEKI
jgi:peptide deformylase